MAVKYRRDRESCHQGLQAPSARRCIHPPTYRVSPPHPPALRVPIFPASHPRALVQALASVSPAALLPTAAPSHSAVLLTQL